MKTKMENLLILFLSLLLLASCAANPPSHHHSQMPSSTPVELGDFLTSERSLATAESLYAAGAQVSDEEDWEKAEQYFSQALMLLTDLSAVEDYPSLADRYNDLLDHLAQEYPVILSYLEELPQEGSLALLSMKLGELRGDTVWTAPVDSSQLLEAQDDDDYDMPIHWNWQVENSIRYFQVENREAFARWLNRSGRYLEMMQGILRQYGLPLDLVYLVLIESGFNPNAYSWAHAAGPWQFISSTAKIYGLKEDWWLDERRDPVKSSHAACKYLKHLYGEFDDWLLAMAAYNCGEVRVRKAIASAGSRDFWDLKLPRQTKNYVPLYMAATIIAKSPKEYEFAVEYENPLDYDVVSIDECTDLKVVARCCGCSYELVKELNPELLRWCTPPNKKDFQLKIPPGTKETFLANYALVPPSEKVTWHRHKIQRGETLSGIAARYGTSVRAITEANSLRSSHRIIAGKYLLIPVAPQGAWTSGRSVVSAGGGEVGKKFIYTVQKGDALSRIAASFGVGLSQLRRWNNLRSGAYIYPGDKLTIYLSSGVIDSAEPSGGYTELVYTVKRGDTLWNIAQDFGVSLVELVRYNDLENPSCIHPGSKLKIKMINRL